MTALTVTPSWRALAAHHTQIKDVHLRTLFADDPGRAERPNLISSVNAFDDGFPDR